MSVPIDEPGSSYSPSELGRLGDAKRLGDLIDGKIRVTRKDEDGESKGDPGPASGAGDDGSGVPKLAMKVGVGVDAKDGSGMTALAHSCRSGYSDVVRDLLSVRQADYDSRADGGWTPLHFASAYGREAELQLLVEAGADASATDARGITPLHLCCKAGNINAVKVLIAEELDLDMDAQTEMGTTAVMMAAANGHSGALKMLVTRGASLDHQDKMGDTALHIAARCGFAGFCARLVSRGASTELRNRDGALAVDVAISKEVRDAIVPPAGVAAPTGDFDY